MRSLVPSQRWAASQKPQAVGWPFCAFRDWLRITVSRSFPRASLMKMPGPRHSCCRALHKGRVDSAPSCRSYFQWKVKGNGSSDQTVSFVPPSCSTDGDGSVGKAPSEIAGWHTCKPSTWEAEAGALVWVWGQPWLQSETLSQRSKPNLTGSLSGNQQSLASCSATEKRPL